ncbi:MAG: 3-dehydroquinate synthase [Clostridia bacterium]|nr:3-dehydroquinate synthase [Clostridia bacterium]
MQKINIPLKDSYDCFVGEDLLKISGEIIKDLSKAEKIMIVSDDVVFSLYGETLKKSLKKSGFITDSFVFKNGEKQKNLDTVRNLLSKMIDFNMTRTDIVVALGGGVVGDLAGFTASIFKRGIKYVQIPTTLLAAVDSSVGGKTGVDFSGLKNQVGAFCQPLAVICDTKTFNTLPYKQYICGAAEVIKYGVISDSKLFYSLKETPIKENYENIVSTCIKIKRDYVLKDEFDLGDRMFLNFGHTIGHAVESLAGFSLTHGESIAVGMAIISSKAAEKGFCEEYVKTDIISMLKTYDLPVSTDIKKEKIVEAVSQDKKTKGDTLSLIVPVKIGECKIENIKKREIKDWI